MREFGGIMVQRLDDEKKVVFKKKDAIDQDFPVWKSRREEFGDDYLRHDSRRELFVSIVYLGRERPAELHASP